MSNLGEKNSLSCEEVCRIIEVSKENSVLSLKFAGLELEFTDQGSEKSNSRSTGQPSATEIAAIQNDESKKALVQEELKLKQQYLDDLVIQDPYALETLIARGDVEEDQNYGDDD